MQPAKSSLSSNVPVSSHKPPALCLAEFANGNYKPRPGNKLKFQMYNNQELTRFSRQKRVLVASNNNLQYSGTNFENDSSKVTSTIVKIGVYNKQTRKWKLYDADYFYIKPILSKKDSNTTEMDGFVQSWKEKSEDLSLTFGSKNKKKAINSRLAYGTTASDGLENTIAMKVAEGTLTVIKAEEQKQESEIIPPRNKNAKCVTEVYNIDDIIPVKEYSTLDSEAIIFTNITSENLLTWKKECKFCFFVLRYLELKFKSISLHNAKLLCYINYMTMLLKCNYKDLRKKDPIPSVPQPYKKILMDNYLVNKAMPQRKKDKLLSHATILALTVSNYNIDMNIWAQSTNVPAKRLTLLSYALGCYVHNQKNEGTRIIELKIPLYEHEERSYKRKR